MMIKTKKKVMFFIILFIILVLSGIFIYYNFINEGTKLKYELLSTFKDRSKRQKLELAIDNLTDKQCKEIYNKWLGGKRNFIAEMTNPGLNKLANVYIIQDIINKNILNVVERIKDTMCVEVDYNEQFTESNVSVKWDYSKGIYKNKKKVSAHFLGPDDYTIRSRYFIQSTKHFSYSGFLLVWELPLILEEAGILKKDSLKNKFSRMIQTHKKGEENITKEKHSELMSENILEYLFDIGLGYRHDYDRELALTIYVFSGYKEEDYKESYKVNSKKLLNDISLVSG